MTTTTHEYFTDKARAAFAAAGGDPDNTGPLAAWAEGAANDRDDVHGVIVAQDGTLVAETVHRAGAAYVARILATDADGHQLRLSYDEVGMAAGQLTRRLGQGVVHLTRSELTKGAGRFARTARIRADLADAAQADAAAQAAQAQARERLREATVAAVHAGLSEYEAAEQASVTRMTVRSWLGK